MDYAIALVIIFLRLIPLIDQAPFPEGLTVYTMHMYINTHRTHDKVIIGPVGLYAINTFCEFNINIILYN